MAWLITIQDLEFLSNELNAKITKGSLTTTNKQEDWFDKPPNNLHEVAAFFSVLDRSGQDKDSFPGYLRYISGKEFARSFLSSLKEINKIKKSVIELDEEDEAYVILKYSKDKQHD